MKTKIIQNVKSVIIILALVVGISYASAAWTNPTATPTGDNTPAPINVGGRDGLDQTKWYNQSKSGVLNLAHLFTSDLTVTNPDGTTTNIPDGSVLTADGANTGKVKWEAPTTTSCDAGTEWIAIRYAAGYPAVYLSPYPPTSYTYAGRTFYIYDSVKTWSGTDNEFIANPDAAFDNATDIPVGSTRATTRYIFNSARLASENTATQQASIGTTTDGFASFMANRYACTANVVNAPTCHVNNSGVIMPFFGRTLGGSIYGSYTDSDSGSYLTTYVKVGGGTGVFTIGSTCGGGTTGGGGVATGSVGGGYYSSYITGGLQWTNWGTGVANQTCPSGYISKRISGESVSPSDPTVQAY